MEPEKKTPEEEKKSDVPAVPDAKDEEILILEAVL